MFQQMTKIFVFIFIYLLFSPFLNCQELHSWIPQNLSYDESFRKVQFIDSDTGFISGYNGTNPALGKSFDSGYNWIVSSITQTNSEATIFFVTSNEGWAVTSDGDILHTTDAGDNWDLQNSSGQSPNWDVYFVNSNYGWVAGTGGARIDYTTNGGTIWGGQFSPISQGLYGVYFNNISDGWMVGNNGTIIGTTNGGSNWFPTSNNATENLKSVFFRNTVGWVVGENGAIHKSTDGGLNWINVSTGYTQDLYSVYFVNESIGWIAGEGLILKTYDGGLNWDADIEDPNQRLRSIYFLDSNNGWAVGRNGKILKYMPFKLLTPNGGEGFLIGSSEQIKWYNNVSSITNIKIEYSTDDGSSWNLIADSVPVSDSIYLWNVSNTPSTDCRIKISDVINASLYEISDEVFTIRSGVIRVPEDFPTIQGAIDFAQPGDSIIVQPNVYIENINLNKEGLIILADGNIDEVIIDGSQTYVTFYCTGDNNVIKGFTITNGKSQIAGGLLTNSNSEFIDIIIKGNRGVAYGGGINCNGPAIFRNVIIEENHTMTNLVNGTIGGGGIYLGPNANPVLENVIIRNNHSGDDGGGMYFDTDPPNGAANAVFDNVIIYNNNANTNGGGIYCRNGLVVFENIKVINNYAGEKGGGIYQGGEPFTLTNAYICNNSTGGDGGGIHCQSLPNITSSTISYNNAFRGGGIYIFGVLVTITEATITNNFATEGNGIYRVSQQNADIMQSNFYNNFVAIYNNSTTHLVNAENNWWGHSSGPYHPTQNPTGQGDSVNVYVDITPFLSSPNLDAPPMPIQNLEVLSSDTNSVLLSWESSPLSDVIGYKVHYDTEASIIFYSNTIDIGNQSNYQLTNLESDINYYISITCYDVDGNESWFSKKVIAYTDDPTNVNGDNMVTDFSLLQNYPNPFNPTTTIKYQIPELSFVTLKVYDVLGSEVVTLVNEEKSVGKHTVEFNGAFLPSGIYFYRLQADSFVETKKMILLR